LVGVTLFVLVVRLGGIIQNTPWHLTLANIIDSMRLEQNLLFFWLHVPCNDDFHQK
jgi:hypothetical protein